MCGFVFPEFHTFVVATRTKLKEMYRENDALKQRLAGASDLDNQVSRYKRQIAEIRREYDMEHQRRTKVERDIEKMVRLVFLELFENVCTNYQFWIAFGFFVAHCVAQSWSILRQERRWRPWHLPEQLGRHSSAGFGELFGPFVSHGHDSRAGQEFHQR